MTDSRRNENAARVDPSAYVVESLGDDAVLVDLGKGVYFALNASAQLVWQHLVVGSSDATIEQALQARFAITAERAHRDRARFVDSLGRHGIGVAAR